MSQSVTPSDGAERWLPVGGHEGLYEVSDLGRVKSLKRGSSRILKPIRRYYYVVGPCKDGKARQRTVHSLVAEAFIGPCPPGQEVRHGPGGRYDNRLVNLSYGTRAENVEDMRRDGTMMTGTRVHFARLTDAAVLECRARAAAGERPAHLAREFGVSWNAVYCAVNGKTWRHLPLVQVPLQQAEVVRVPVIPVYEPQQPLPFAS